MRVKWFGTAGIMLEDGGTRLLFDPFPSLNAKTRRTPPEEKYRRTPPDDQFYQPPPDDLSSATHIFVTHGHFDHIAGIPAIWKSGGGTARVYATKTPRETLIAKGVSRERINIVRPGDVLTVGPFEIRALKGRHVRFDKRLIINTITRIRIIKHWKNLCYIFSESRVCKEAGEILVYDIRASGKRILLMGSLNLDAATEYPKGADLLILPFQGRSDINAYALRFIDRLKPKKALLDHFDDTFPPISSAVDTAPFISLTKEKHPDIPVVCLSAGAGWMIV